MSVGVDGLKRVDFGGVGLNSLYQVGLCHPVSKRYFFFLQGSKLCLMLLLLPFSTLDWILKLVTVACCREGVLNFRLFVWVLDFGMWLSIPRTVYRGGARWCGCGDLRCVMSRPYIDPVHLDLDTFRITRGIVKSRL